ITRNFRGLSALIRLRRSGRRSIGARSSARNRPPQDMAPCSLGTRKSPSESMLWWPTPLARATSPPMGAPSIRGSKSSRHTKSTCRSVASSLPLPKRTIRTSSSPPAPCADVSLSRPAASHRQGLRALTKKPPRRAAKELHGDVRGNQAAARIRGRAGVMDSRTDWIRSSRLRRWMTSESPSSATMGRRFLNPGSSLSGWATILMVASLSCGECVVRLAKQLHAELFFDEFAEQRYLVGHFPYARVFQAHVHLLALGQKRRVLVGLAHQVAIHLVTDKIRMILDAGSAGVQAGDKFGHLGCARQRDLSSLRHA